MHEGVDGLLRDKTCSPGKTPVAADKVSEAMRLTRAAPLHEAMHPTAPGMASKVGLAVSTVQKI